MRRTEFPTLPSEVAVLTVAEFTSDMDLEVPGSFDRVCGRYPEDANRAVVWFIRFRALNAWRERGEVAAWLRVNASLEQHARNAAASFALNEDWEFPTEAFRLAVESMGRSDTSAP